MITEQIRSSKVAQNLVSSIGGGMRLMAVLQRDIEVKRDEVDRQAGRHWSDHVCLRRERPLEPLDADYAATRPARGRHEGGCNLQAGRQATEVD